MDSIPEQTDADLAFLGGGESIQKRPDVRKIVLSVKLRPPSLEKVSILRIFY